MKLLTRLREEFFPKSDAFDRQFGIRTSGKVALKRLRINSPNKRAGSRYEGVSPEIFANAIRYVPANRTFIDLGCGKGRALILAHHEGFEKLIGVEFSPALANSARSNLEQIGIPATIIDGDASDFVFPDEPHVVFLYNPFGPEVLRKIIPRINGYVVYVCAKHKAEFASMELVQDEPCFSIFRN